jgi:hypothetical protein
MPIRAGTLAEARTQVDLRCDYCGHELSIEMTPPVLIVTPDRETDCAASPGEPPTAREANQAGDRRNSHDTNMQRMRVGLRGLLMSVDETHTVSVLYSLDGLRARGRMRPLNPSRRFPSWMDPESRLTLRGYDGLPLDIRVTVVKIPLVESKNDDHFAEFVVRQVPT